MSGDPPPKTNESPRVLRDARTMRALSHPVRIALLDALILDGPLTATQAGERIGESPTTCSFHLRQLAQYGFVEEAGGGKGRARPWRANDASLRFSTVQEDPETEIAAATLGRLFREQRLQRLEGWLTTSRSFPREWQQAASSTESMVWLTAQELTDLNEQVVELIKARFPGRRRDRAARPAGALPVEVLTFSYPLQPPNHPEATS